MQADTLFSGSVVQDTTITAAEAAAAAAPADTAAVTVADATNEAVDTVQGFVDGFFAALPAIAVAIVVFLAFVLVARGIRSLIHRVTPGPRDSNIGIVLGRLAYATLLVVGVLIGLVIIFPTFTIASLLGALGLGGVALGFAFQDIFQNLLAGILILIREPFREGDEITSGDFTGTVEAIETRATFIRTYDGRRVIIPNSQIYSDPVQVITAYHMVRTEYDIGIGYGDDVDRAKQIALDTVGGIEGILKDPAPDILTWDLAGSSINLRLRWWTDPTRANVVKTRDRVLQAVAAKMAEGGIDLPFPTQVVLFHDQTEETDGDRTRQREGWPAGDNPPRPARVVDAERRGDGASETVPRASIGRVAGSGRTSILSACVPVSSASLPSLRSPPAGSLRRHPRAPPQASLRPAPYPCDGCEITWRADADTLDATAMLAGPDEPGERLVLSGRVLAPDGETPASRHCPLRPPDRRSGDLPAGRRRPRTPGLARERRRGPLPDRDRPARAVPERRDARPHPCLRRRAGASGVLPQRRRVRGRPGGHRGLPRRARRGGRRRRGAARPRRRRVAGRA